MDSSSTQSKTTTSGAGADSSVPVGLGRGAGRHLWEYVWFRDLAVLLLIALVLLMAWWVRAILLPVVLGLALAYIVNPTVTWLQRRWKIARWISTLGVLVLFLGVVSGFLLYVVPRLLGQVYTLAGNVPQYLKTLAEKLQGLLNYSRSLSQTANSAASDPQTVDAAAHATQTVTTVTTPEITSTVATAGPATVVVVPGGEGAAHAADPNQIINAITGLDWNQIGATALKWLGMGVGLAQSAFSLVFYIVLAIMITSLCFFYFSWRFDAIVAWFDQFIPISHRERTMQILGRMDSAIAAWFRGRLLQACIVATILSTGWYFAGVKYFLLLGLIGGTLNLVPYMSSLTVPGAIALLWLDQYSHGNSFSIMAVFIWPTLVYVIAQSVDGWVVEPLVQGKATSLDPLTVLLAVLIGGTLAGVLGMVLAIPTAACIKILWQEVLQQRVKILIRGAAKVI